MTQDQKDQFKDWLINNLHLTSVSNVELIIKHVEHYYCPTTENELKKENVLRDALEKIKNRCVGKYITSKYVKNICEAALDNKQVNQVG